MSEVWQVLSSLESERKLDRDNGIEKLTNMVKTSGVSDLIDTVNKKIDQIAKDPGLDWKIVYSVVCSLRIAFSAIHSHRVGYSRYLAFALKQLEHAEYRVRIEAGKLVGALVWCQPQTVIEVAQTKLIVLLRENSARAEGSRDNQSCGTGNEEPLFEDTTGWKFLETSVKAFESLIQGCSKEWLMLVTTDMENLVLECSTHVNRFVRETCMSVVNTMLEKGILSIKGDNEKLVQQIRASLIERLCDNWSQVRLAASIAVRKFLLLMKEFNRLDIVDSLLPAVCHNRHYLAEGVKLYNIKTWELITQKEGMDIVKRNIKEYVTFYTLQAKSDNHAVREAVCHNLAELAYLLGPHLDQNHTCLINETLICCLNDDSWPVRDASCAALSFLIESNPSFFSDKLEQLVHFFSDNLQNSIPSVRHGAAVSVSVSCLALPILMSPILDFISENLALVEQQPSEHVPSSLSGDPAIFGVVYEADSEARHVDQTMYSCGSLAPKMKAQGCAKGCSGGGFIRRAQPWEVSDGCLAALGELCKRVCHNNAATRKLAPTSPEEVESRDILTRYLHQKLPVVSQLTRLHAYPAHFQFLCTFTTHLQHFARLIGARDFQNLYLDFFFDQLFYCVTQEHNQNLKLTSQACLAEISSLLGSRVFTNRCYAYFGDLHEKFTCALQKLN